VAAQPRQAGLEIAGEVNVLAAAHAERQLGVAVEQQRGDRLLVFEGARPLRLAGGRVFHAVARQHEEQALAIADRVGKLRVPIADRLQVAPVQPDGAGGRPGGQRVGPA
jgi:hypothetical protein